MILMPFPFLDPSLTPVFTTFLFVFAIVYGALGASAVFKQKGVNIVIALAFAIFAASYQPLVATLQDFLPIAAAIIVVLFFVLLIKKVFSKKEGSTAFDAVPVVVALAVALLLLGAVWGDLTTFLPVGISASNVLWVVASVAIILIFWFIYKHKP